jgi:hypothetical protein
MATSLPAPPPRGAVILHAACRPALPAGEYSLRVAHELTKTVRVEPPVSDPARDVTTRLDNGSKPLPGERNYPFAIDAPRFTLDPSMIHAVFPPTNGVGSYVSRLPMIVLRRRTLPWERSLAPGSDAPWLAVLLFEKGEATTLSPCTVADVLDGAGGAGSPQLDLPDVPDAVRSLPCMGLELPLDLFKDIAPMASEIPLLTHVRQVNTEDKELMGMDDDGWFAVVVGNRLPEPGKQYEACLVSLEGTQAFLPTEAEAAEFTAADLDRPRLAEFADKIERWRGQVLVDDPGLSQAVIDQVLLDHMQSTGSAYQWQGSGPQAPTAQPFQLRGTRAPIADAAQQPQRFQKTATTKTTSTSGFKQPAHASHWSQLSDTQGRLTGRAESMAVKFLIPKVRLFMLAQWSFECREGGDFESIMQALPRNGGVAMLGMPPSLAQAPGSTGAAVWRAALDSGHVPLQHLTRDGEQTIAWYRGPLTPVGVARERSGPYHSADQARRLDPATGLENLGYAAAFEIGRLMALGDPRFALDLMHWRRDGRLSVDTALFGRLIGQRLAFGALPELLNPRAMLLMPRVLASFGTQTFGDLMQGGRLGALRDPTGLLAVRERLPGLDAAVVASAKGLNLQVVQSVMGSLALSGSLLDEIGFGQAEPLEARLDVLLQDPTRHFAPQLEAFNARLNTFRGPL